jgi:hypothetical protein
MNRHHRLSLLGCLFLVACTFDAPLAPEADLPIDANLIGTWEILPEAGDEPTGETVIIRQDGDTRYAIEHHDSDSVIHFSAWLGEIKGTRFVQLEVTGDEHGPAEAGEPDLYSVIAYVFDGSDVVFRSLNTELVDPDAADTAALRAAFLRHTDHPDLFIEPGRLRRR